MCKGPLVSIQGILKHLQQQDYRFFCQPNSQFVQQFLKQLSYKFYQPIPFILQIIRELERLRDLKILHSSQFHCLHLLTKQFRLGEPYAYPLLLSTRAQVGKKYNISPFLSYKSGWLWSHIPLRWKDIQFQLLLTHIHILYSSQGYANILGCLKPQCLLWMPLWSYQSGPGPQWLQLLIKCQQSQLPSHDQQFQYLQGSNALWRCWELMSLGLRSMGSP